MNRRTFFRRAAAGVAASSQAPGQSARTVTLTAKRGSLTAVHTMVDMPEWASELGKYFDPARFVRLCRDAHVELIELKTKNAVGDAMFPFAGRPCHRDWSTETCALAKKAGLRFIAYYNVGLDNWMARQRPEWRCVDPKGEQKIAFGAFNWMCIRSPWRDQVISEVRQVQEKLRAHGMWFDLLGMPNAYGIGSFDPAQACFCPHCRKAYRDRFGTELPVRTDDPEVRLRVYRFGHEGRIRMFRDLSDMLLGMDGKLELGYNGAGNYDALNGTPQDLQDRVTYNSSEAKQHRLISFTTKMMYALGKPYQIHTYGGFMRMQPGAVNGTWAAWNLIPPAYLDVAAAIATAHAGRICIGVNPLPNGKVYEGEFTNVGQVLRSVKDREPWLEGLQSVPGIAIVYDAASDLAVMPLASARASTPVREEASGLHNALVDAGLHFDVTPVHRLEAQRHRVILLGNTMAPSDSLRQSLEQFVRAGGLLIATHETSLRDPKGQRLPDFAWRDLFGVRFRGVSPFREANYGWLSDELRGPAPAYPMLFTSPVLEVECDGARPLAELVYPEGHRTPEVFTDGETPYTHFQKFTGKPLVTLHRVGQGSVMYIAGPIGTEILTRDDTWLKRLLAFAVKKYATGLPVDARVPPGVQVVFGRKAGVHVLSLVNHYVGLAVSGEDAPHPQVGPVEVTIPLKVLGGAPKAVQSIDATAFRWRVQGEQLRLEANSIGHHALIILQS